jgi:ribonucleoside-triphosphate reductase
LIEKLQKKYGQEIFNLDGIGKQLDIFEFTSEYMKSSKKATSDLSVDPNANISEKSIIAYEVELPKGLFRLNSYFMMWKRIRSVFKDKELADRTVEANITGDIYINDFHRFGAGAPYCFAYSCYDIMVQGLPFITKVSSVPAKHADTFMEHVIQSVVYFSNSTAGAVSLPDLFFCLAYYIKKDVEDGIIPRDLEKRERYINQLFQIFTYTMNQPFRSGHQSAFTNVSVFDRNFLEDLFGKLRYPDGSFPDFDLIDKLQKMYVEFFAREQTRTQMTFPLVTGCLSIDDEKEIRDKDFLAWLARVNRDFGFINIYCGKLGILSSCCRLRNDSSNEFFSSLGAGGVKIGSCGVSTINLPRIAHKARSNKDRFFKELEEIMTVNFAALLTRRRIIERRIQQGRLPLYNLGFMHLDQQYCTTGFIGAYEACEVMGIDPISDDGKNFLLEVFDYMNKRNTDASKRYSAPFNLEQIPGEGAAVKLLKKDNLLGYGDGEYYIYSNQFTPLTKKIDILDRIRIHGQFDAKMTGGAICHINLSERVHDYRQMESVIKVAAKLGVVYFAINYVIGKCKNNHLAVTDNKRQKCTVCGCNITNKFTRVVGFLTDVSDWIEERREKEFPDRVFYEKVD